MDKERELLMIKIAKVRTAAREIMKLCKNDDVSWATSRLVTEKCEDIINLTTPIIFEDEL